MTTRTLASSVGHARHALARPRRTTRAATAARPGWRATTVASARGEPSSSSPSASRRTALVAALAGAAFAARDLTRARAAVAGEKPVDMKALVRAFDTVDEQLADVADDLAGAVRGAARGSPLDPECGAVPLCAAAVHARLEATRAVAQLVLDALCSED
mgnify:CR=1 FL=1